MKIVALFIVTFIVCSTTVLSQNADPDIQAQIWTTRAETISANLVKETTNIEELEQSLLYAELGNAWWKLDRNKADAFFTKSVDGIFFYSPGNDASKLLETTRKILLLLGNRNEKQSARLVKIISDVAEAPELDKNANADALVAYGLQILSDNPATAYKMGALAIRIGTPKEIYKLIWGLNKNNHQLATDLFKIALLKAKTDPNYYMLQAIKISAFPEVIISEIPEHLKLSRSEKIAALNFFADTILRLQSKYLSKQIEKCSYEATVIAQLKNQFVEFLSEQYGPVQQAIATCLENQSAQTQALTDTIRNSTVEELLKLADEHKDEPLLRTAYLYRAALLAHEEKRYALSITVLETMDEKERSSDIDFWEDLRSGAASHLAFEKYTAEDVQGANKVIADVPDPIEPFAQFGLVTLFPVDDAASLPFRIEVLSEARKNFLRSDKTFARKASYWFRLVGLFSDVGLQQDAADTFREVVKAFNADQSEKSATQIEISPEMVSGSFSPKLLEAMDSSILETVRLINKPQSRIDVNFALLRIALTEAGRLKIIAAKVKTTAE